MALFVALSGSAYALTIPNNSVGAKQLKKNAVTSLKIKKGAVTSAKVRDRSLLAKDFKLGQLPVGPPGPQGAKGDTGPQGPRGDTGLRLQKIVSNPGPNSTATPALLTVGDVTLTGSCLEDGLGQHTASVTVSGPNGVYSGVAGGDWGAPQSVAANVLPSSSGTSVGNPSLATTHKLISLAVVTPNTAVALDIFVGINLHGNDCVFSVSGTTG